ncbi:MAG TPA: sodium:proton antiporter [Hanamia sp.]|nr:sodium:proton antiporter [Hanamia sp.]
MDMLTIITILIIISAAFSYFNERFIKLPGTIGVITISVVVSIIILVAGKTNNTIAKTIVTLANSINFSKVLLDVMLGLLLFASALHFDYKKLKAQRFPVLLLSTLGVLVSAGVFGGLLYGVTLLLKINLPLVYCFIFGALISPTDPIAVGAILKNSKISPKLNTIISGESMFNDAIGLVLFVTLLSVANQSAASMTVGSVAQLFAREVLGGIGIGLVAGFLGYRMIKSIKDFQTILLISIALVLGISVIAHDLEVSIPLAAVTAGLIIGNESLDKRHIADQFLSKIWQLFDEVLNTILFVMIGLQLVIMPFLNHYWQIGFFSIIVILIARLVSVSMPAIFLLRKVSFNNLFILTWAGLRGGISVAMALSLPDSPYREIILSSCYFIVIFSIIVQGLTLNKVVAKAVNTKDASSEKSTV